MVALPPRSGPGKARRLVARFGPTFVVGSVVGIWVLTTADEGFGQPLQIQARNLAGSTDDGNDLYGVHLPTDRRLSRGIDRARQRIADGQYHEVLEFLQQILDQEEDSFIEDSSDSDSHRGLRATARQMVAELPPEGRQMYQLLHAATARRLFEKAMSSGDRETLAKLVRQYLLTPAGFEAALVLAQLEFDRGDPLAAAHLYQRLKQNPQAAAQFEPQLSLLAAVSWAAAGQTDRVAAVLRSVSEDYPGTTVHVAGRELNLPNGQSSDEELSAWLSNFIGSSWPRDTTYQDWPTQRGDLRRNADHDGGAPHLRARWQARVVNDPRMEGFLSSRRRQLEQHGMVAIPAARPIAVGNVVLMRTPRNIVAVDWQTGKRIWETREEEGIDWDQSLTELLSGKAQQEWPTNPHPLEQRIWDDLLTMSLGSDGQRVFVLSGTSQSPLGNNMRWGMNRVFRGRLGINSAPTNRLSAYELATEGKLAWEIDGANAVGELAGAFFLGPPLAVNDTLFVLAEVRSAIYLLALDSSSGRLVWRQQLAGLEQSILLDPHRRLHGATPSFAAGMLICPTGSGMIVGVDIVQREFAWVYRYPRQIGTTVQFQRGWRGRPQNFSVREPGGGWLDGSVIVDDGRVFLTPPESAELYCLDLHSGKQLWKKLRDQSVYLACVDHGTVLLVGNKTLSAIRAADGTSAWSEDEFELPSGAMPAGLGYLSRGRYFLPLTSGQVIAVDVSSGTTSLLNDSPGDVMLGNFICHRGAILSQSAWFLEKYEQIDVLRERAEASLAKNPRDAAAIRDLAEMQRLEGALDEAIGMLEQAYAIAPNDLLTRNMLADSLLEALTADFRAVRDKLPLLRQLIDDPQRRIDLLRIEAQGLQSIGEAVDSFAAYLRLADAVRREPQSFAISAAQTVRSDCWVRGRLNTLWADSTSDERLDMTRQLDTQRAEWLDHPTVAQLRRYLDYFGGLPRADDVRLQLVRQLIDRGDSLDAEMELLKLERSPDPVVQAAGTVLMSNWLLASDRLDEARRVAATLDNRWPDKPTSDGKTGRQWLAELAPELQADHNQLATGWPRGQVTVELAPTTSLRRGTGQARDQFQFGLRRLRVEQVFRPGLGPDQWLIAQDGTRFVGRNGLGRDLIRFGGNQGGARPQFPGRSDWIQAAQLGDLLYITFGGQIVAIDFRRRGEDRDEEVLWRAYPAGQFPAILSGVGRRGSRNLYHPWSERQRMSSRERILLGALGPVSPSGVVIQEQDQLRRVDPVTGETLWARSDIPVGCELFGDDELLLAADANRSTIYVINTTDGRLLERRNFPTTSWMLTAGRNVARLSDTSSDLGARKTLRVVDLVSGKTLLVTDYAPTARMTTIEPDSIAIVEPPDRVQLAQNLGLAAAGLPFLASRNEGRFQLIDVGTGRVRIDESIPVVADLKGIEAIRSGDQLFLMIDGRSRQRPSRYIGIDYPLIDGLVYAFDLRSGTMMWPGPAVVERRGIALMQPTDIPLLVFVDREVKRDAGESRTQLRLLCLDKRSGATVYRNDALPDTAGGHFRILATQTNDPSVTIEMSARTVRLTYSDRPRSPKPPSNDRVEAPRKNSDGGLLGVGRRMGQAIQARIRNPNGTKRPLAESEPSGPADAPSDDE